MANQHIHTHRDPDLGLHRVLAGAVISLDPQVLFDPLEEQSHLPALLVDASDGQRRKGEVVGQELKPLTGLGVVIIHVP